MSHSSAFVSPDSIDLPAIFNLIYSFHGLYGLALVLGARSHRKQLIMVCSEGFALQTHWSPKDSRKSFKHGSSKGTKRLL